MRHCLESAGVKSLRASQVKPSPEPQGRPSLTPLHCEDLRGAAKSLPGTAVCVVSPPQCSPFVLAGGTLKSIFTLVIAEVKTRVCLEFSGVRRNLAFTLNPGLPLIV